MLANPKLCDMTWGYAVIVDAAAAVVIHDKRVFNLQKEQTMFVCRAGISYRVQRLISYHILM